MVWYLAIHWCWLWCQCRPDTAMLFGSPKTNLLTWLPGLRGIYVAFTSLGFSGVTARNARCPPIINRYHIKKTRWLVAIVPWWHVWPPWWTMSNTFSLVHSACSGWRSTKCKTIHLESVPGQQTEKNHAWYHIMKCQYFQRDRSWNAVAIPMNYWQSMEKLLYRGHDPYTFPTQIV